MYNPNEHMRYESDHKARTHQRIIKNAARQVRNKGLNGPGVAAVMKASGLTVGGFYKHFRSKDDLLFQAIEEGMDDFGGKLFAAIKQVPSRERWREIVKWYLSDEHCEHPETGCPMAALAPEIARAAPAVKKRILVMMKMRREHMLEFMPGRTREEKERNFTVLFASMAGAVSMARTMSDPAEKEKVLSSVRDHLLESF
jgi:TetR/AcrR family transcriptional repressor of nem operon